MHTETQIIAREKERGRQKKKNKKSKRKTHNQEGTKGLQQEQTRGDSDKIELN